MKIRAVIADVYKTLLEVSPAIDPEGEWRQLWGEFFGGAPRFDWKTFCEQADAAIAREHGAARLAGIAYPEVLWPGVVSEVVSEFDALSASRREEFLVRQTRCWHSVRAMPGAVDALVAIKKSGVKLGVASNAQAYTLREMDEALAGTGFGRDMFDPALNFFSYAHGFSKPDPHVFRLLTARLRSMEIQPSEALMVGDRFDNDIAPAQAQGWQTWQLKSPPDPQAGPGGDWGALVDAYYW